MHPHGLFLALARTVTLCVATLACGFALRRNALADEPTPLASFEIAKGGDHLVVPVEIGGETRQFLLDTACNYHNLDVSLTSDLELQRTIKIPGAPPGTPETRTFACPAMKLGPLDMRTSKPALEIDLAEARRTSGHDLRGIIGLHWLKQYVVRVDFDQGRLELFDRLTHYVPSWGEPVPMGQMEGWCTVEVTAGGVADRAIIDTGASGVSLKKSLLERLTREGKAKLKSRTPITTAFGVEESSVYVLDHFTAIHASKSSVVVLDHALYNLVGLAYLARFNIVFDFPRQVLYVKRGAGFDRPRYADRTGLMLARQDGATIVDRVKENSPAAKAGITVGDRLVSVDSREPGAMSLFELRRLLSEWTAPTISLHIEREGQGRDVSLSLKDE